MSAAERSEHDWSAPSPLDPIQERRELRRALAPIILSFGTFVVASFTVPLNAHVIDEAVLVVIVGLIVAAGRMGGRGPALYGALMGALSFDFFHIEPIRVLHARTLLLALGLFGLVAVLAGRRRSLPIAVTPRRARVDVDRESH